MDLKRFLTNVEHPIIYMIYWTVGAVLVGMILAQFILPIPNQASRMMSDDRSDAAHQMKHEKLFEQDPKTAPTIALDLQRDLVSGWNLTVETTNFTFTPASEGQESVQGEGHAHLYLNGIKIARLYGPHFHIPDVTPGSHTLRVTLNASDHASLSVNGRIIAAETELVQSE